MKKLFFVFSFLLSLTIFNPVLLHAFNSTDFDGIWNVHELISGDRPLQESGWCRGWVNVDSAANATYSITNHNNQTNTGTRAWTFVISDTGIITDPSNPTTKLHGIMSADKKLFIFTQSEQPKNQPKLSILVKQVAGTSFSSADFEGTWNMHLLTTGDSPQWLGWAHGVSSIDSSGNVTWSSITRSDGNSTLPAASTLSISSSGIVSSTDAPSLYGVMSQDKNTIIVTMNDGGGGYNLITYQKSAGSYMTSDLQGTWNIHLLTSGDSPQWLGWAHGVSSIDSSGNVTWSSITRSDGNSTLPTAGTLSITSSGIVSSAGSTSFHGVISQDKNTIIVTMNDGGGGYDLMIFTRQSASDAILYGTFTDAGIWQWTGSAWTQLTPDNPESIVAAGTNLYGKFANGIWQWTGSGWTHLTPDRPAGMVASGTNLYGNFTGNGIWQWNGSGWTQLTPDNPESMVAADSNLYGKFGNGIWQWTGSGWTKLTPDRPADMVAAGSNLYGSFTGSGIWQWNGSGWSLLTSDIPEAMAAAGSNLYGKFGNGIWQWNGSGWTKLTSDRPASMAAAGSNLYGSFTGNGIWQWNGSGWTQLTPDNPAIMAVGD